MKHRGNTFLWMLNMEQFEKMAPWFGWVTRAHTVAEAKSDHGQSPLVRALAEETPPVGQGVVDMTSFRDAVRALSESGRRSTTVPA